MRLPFPQCNVALQCGHFAPGLHKTSGLLQIDAMAELHALHLSIQGLDVTRGDRVVAAGISFDLHPGQALCLRGENGTGKTSILRTLAGFARPAAGRIAIQIDGQAADPAEVRARHIHWLGGEDGLAERLSVVETVHFWAKLFDVTAPDDLLNRVGLQGKEEIPTGRLSTGQRRRLGLARLVLAPRALWLLDEPMSGLDEGGRKLVLDMVRAQLDHGGIVLMASHDEGIPASPTLRLSPLVEAA